MALSTTTSGSACDADKTTLWVKDQKMLMLSNHLHTTFHSNHAIKLVLALSGSVQIETASASTFGKILLLNSDIKHRLVASGIVALCFIDPHGSDSQAIKANFTFKQGCCVLSDDKLTVQRICCKLDCQNSATVNEENLYNQLLALLRSRFFQPRKALDTDRRVSTIMGKIEADPKAAISVASFGKDVSLSQSRLTTLFKQEVGISIKQYAKNVRVKGASQELRKGKSVTEVALEYGFFDLAHFSKAYKDVLGCSPSQMSSVVSYIKCTFRASQICCGKAQFAGNGGSIVKNCNAATVNLTGSRRADR